MLANSFATLSFLSSQFRLLYQKVCSRQVHVAKTMSEDIFTKILENKIIICKYYNETVIWFLL